MVARFEAADSLKNYEKTVDAIELIMDDETGVQQSRSLQSADQSLNTIAAYYDTTRWRRMSGP